MYRPGTVCSPLMSGVLATAGQSSRPAVARTGFPCLWGSWYARVRRMIGSGEVPALLRPA